MTDYQADRMIGPVRMRGELPLQSVHEHIRCVSGAHPSSAAGVNLKEAMRLLLETTLPYCAGNKTQSAVALGCSLKTLYNKLNGRTREIAFSPN